MGPLTCLRAVWQHLCAPSCRSLGPSCPPALEKHGSAEAILALLAEKEEKRKAGQEDRALAKVRQGSACAGLRQRGYRG